MAGRCWSACGQAIVLGLLLLLSACGGGPQTGYTGARQSNYAPPGPPEDPWGPYIREAAQRFAVPEKWIRAVMRQESGGHEYLHGQLVTSDAGAAGLMQIMPATYEDLRSKYSLGNDPYDPHDNIIAGTGYIRDLYESYGSPAFLAAYNAGPRRVDDYMAGRGALPNETVNYLASVAPLLGNDRPMTGPLATYAGSSGVVEVAAAADVPRAYARAPSPGCWQDPDAAYDPDAPCRAPPVREANGLVERGGFTRVALAAPVPFGATQAAAVSPAPIATSRPNCWHDPDAAYDPDAPCQTPPRQSAPPTGAPAQTSWGQSAPATISPPATPVRIAAAGQPHIQRVSARGGWAVQVGAYTDPDQARRVAESVRNLAPSQLGSARAVLGTTAPFGNRVLFRARLSGLSWENALSACGQLSRAGQACVAVPPGQ